MEPLKTLADAYYRFSRDPSFKKELANWLEQYAGRPTPLFPAANLNRHTQGARIYLKREDLLHGGAHKINNTLGQALLAKKMGKRRIIAETGAGQHGVATAMACAALGLKAEIYMGSEDMERQRLNVYRMKVLGAQVHPVESGSKTLKDAINEALRDWVTNVEDTYYLLGSVLGPHPYPTMVRDFQSVIGRETKEQVQALAGRLPDLLVACVGGGSNSIGLFHAFLNDRSVRMVGVEAGGKGITSGLHAARFADPSVGVLHGTKTHVLQDDAGQIRPTHSISAGLDYPAVGPEHAALHAAGRVVYESATDEEALDAFDLLARTEGILPAPESSHALAYLVRVGRSGMGGTAQPPALAHDSLVVVNLSG